MLKQTSTLVLGLSALLTAACPYAQTTYPEKSIRIIVGLPPGGQPDLVARLLGERLSEVWGKAVVVENISGAGGNLAAERVVRAVPDGYTLGLFTSAQLAINPSLYKLTFDPTKDLAPISQVASSPIILVVHNSVPAKSVKALVALAKAQPGRLTFASSGSGSGPHMAAELFKSIAGIDMLHIPYKGMAAAIPDLLGGRVDLMFSPPVAVLPLARDGKLRALGVTSLKRSSALPELPAIAESYAGFEFTAWNGLVAPAKTSALTVSKLHLEVVKALAAPTVRAKFNDLGLEGIGNSPEEFAGILRSEINKWGKVINKAGIKLE